MFVPLVDGESEPAQWLMMLLKKKKGKKKVRWALWHENLSVLLQVVPSFPPCNFQQTGMVLIDFAYSPLRPPPAPPPTPSSEMRWGLCEILINFLSFGDGVGRGWRVRRLGTTEQFLIRAPKKVATTAWLWGWGCKTPFDSAQFLITAEEPPN